MKLHNVIHNVGSSLHIDTPAVECANHIKDMSSFPKYRNSSKVAIHSSTAADFNAGHKSHDSLRVMRYVRHNYT